MVVDQFSFATAPLSGHTVLGVEPTLAVLALVFGSALYWDARNRSMETAELWGVLIAGLWLTSIVAGLVAVVGYLGSRPARTG
jgi:hypothetical protein